MKSLVVCTSTSHGSIRVVAERMAEVQGAEVITSEADDPSQAAS